MHVNRGRDLDPTGAACACAVTKPTSRQFSGRPGQRLGPARLGAARPGFRISGAGRLPLNDSLHRFGHELVKKHCWNVVLIV